MRKYVRKYFGSPKQCYTRGNILKTDIYFCSIKAEKNKDFKEWKKTRNKRNTFFLPWSEKSYRRVHIHFQSCSTASDPISVIFLKAELAGKFNNARRQNPGSFKRAYISALQTPLSKDIVLERIQGKKNFPFPHCFSNKRQEKI